MENNKVGFTSIDEYIATFPEDIQKILEELRATIKAAAPEATEKISYQMPTFYLKGNLVHFAAYKHHIGFYPAPRGIENENVHGDNGLGFVEETRIRNRHNVSLAEVEHQDLWQRARLAIVSVNTDHVHLEHTLQSALSEAEGAREIQVLDAQTEVL